MSTTEDQIADNFTKPLPKASFTRDQEIYWGDITWHMRLSEVAECIKNITLKWGSVSIQVLKQCSFKDEIFIPFERSPKIIITTNYVINGVGSSHESEVFIKQYNYG